MLSTITCEDLWHPILLCTQLEKICSLSLMKIARSMSRLRRKGEKSEKLKRGRGCWRRKVVAHPVSDEKFGIIQTMVNE